MQLVVNGEDKEVSLERGTIAGLLDALGVPRERVAVEVNGTLVPKTEHPDHALQRGDRVEIVTLVGGG